MPHDPNAMFDASAGLCSLCLRARTVESSKGSTFWLCERSQDDSRFRKYPVLPVTRCDGFERPPPPPE